jgi:hypothetical protein
MNRTGGFITLQRQIKEWEWYHNANTFCLFVHLLLMANFEDGRFEGIDVKRGQLVTSLSSLVKETGQSLQQVRTALDHLISTGEITSTAYPHYRLISIVNYGLYQDKQQGKQQGNNKASTRQATRLSTTEQQQYNNITNINNDIYEQGNNNLPSPEGRVDGFEDFWTEYPRKVSKQDAITAWKKLKPDGNLLDDIMTGLMKHKNSDQWNRDDGRYIPYPATWLNKRKWEDEIQPNIPKKEPPAQRPAKTVVAQQYEQRDYSGETDDVYRQHEDAMDAYFKSLRGEG